MVNGKYCCSQLFINHRCFSGPYLNKGRIAELPKAVGPGKCAVVLKEVQSSLVLEVDVRYEDFFIFKMNGKGKNLYFTKIFL